MTSCIDNHNDEDTIIKSQPKQLYMIYDEKKEVELSTYSEFKKETL